MCTLMVMEKTTKVFVPIVIAYTGDLSQFPELDIYPVIEKSVPKVVVPKKNNFQRRPKNNISNDECNTARYLEMIYGPCNEAVTYQGSAKREAIREPVDTAYCIYIQRGHLYLAKLDSTQKPKKRRSQRDIHKDRRLRANGSGKTKAVVAQF